LSTGFRADAVATAKRDLETRRDPRRRGRLHGGRQADAGASFLRIGGLPLGLAHGVKLLKPVAAGQPLRWADVAVDESSHAVKVRREMERLFALHPEATSLMQ